MTTDLTTLSWYIHLVKVCEDSLYLNDAWALFTVTVALKGSCKGFKQVCLFRSNPFRSLCSCTCGGEHLCPVRISKRPHTCH